MKTILASLAVIIASISGTHSALAQDSNDTGNTNAQVGGSAEFTVDPSWPKPLPYKWELGQVAGIAVDRNDNIWIIQRPRSLTPR